MATMFYRDSAGYYRTPGLDAYDWLVYGFGTRASTHPDQARLATLHQVHSSDVISAAGRTGCLGNGDALISDTPGRLVAVKTADCLPILMIDPLRRVVAAVHAGWRGTARQICRRTADSLCRQFGTRPADLHVAMGPGIGGCCYEVGPEVAAEFGQDGRGYVDLAEANRRQLLELGVPPARIELAGLCTMCGAEDFWSYRRDKQGAGRMLSFAGIR